MVTAVLTTEFTLVSSVPGRHRWHIPELIDRPRYCAAVQSQLLELMPGAHAVVNSLTGRVLLESPTVQRAEAEALLQEALQASPLSRPAYENYRTNANTGKARKLVAKLIIGGSKLLLIFANKLVWGSLAASPVGLPLTVLSIGGTVITGYDFIRALVRTVTGQSGVTTGTLVGAATVSSLMLRENVTALIVLWLLNLGEYLEILTLRRTRRAIRQLLSIDDDEVWLLKNGAEVSVRVKSIAVGDRVVVREGRRITVDGVIISGQGAINEAPITGESMPVSRHAGDSVYAGTVVLSGRLEIEVTDVGSDTVVGRLIQRVEEAQTLKPNIQTVGDAFARKVVPSSFAAALLVFLVTRDPRRALTMMLVACPCAAGLATPTAVSASIGNGARRGILIKGGTHLEAMASVDTVCLDKTGTLTKATPQVSRIVAVADGYEEAAVLQIAARAERHSQHPLAIAILSSASLPSDQNHSSDHFEVLAGRGVRTTNGELEILVGNARLLEEFHVEIPASVAEIYEGHARNAETMIYVAEQRQLIGMVGVSAPIRAEAKETIDKLRASGIKHVVMLTGDSEPVAKAIAGQAGLSEWHSRLLPEDKFKKIQQLRDAGAKVAMVGDGINDAPALALADVGIAMGTGGSDVAIETADVALAADDLRGLPSVVQLSRRTMSVIRQNYGLALGTNSIGLYLAAMGSINPIIAAVLHNLSTILVIGNSTRMMRFDPTGQNGSFRYALGSAHGSAHHQDADCSGCCSDSRTSGAKKKKLKSEAA